MWDDDAIAVYERQAQLVRDAGALGELPIHLQALALERAWLGDLSGARRLMAESESISTSIGNRGPAVRAAQDPGPAGAGSRGLPVDRGRHPSTARARGQGIAVMVAHWAAAVLYNGLGRYEEAASAAREVATNGILPWLSMWALVRAGRGRRARRRHGARARCAGRARGDHATCGQRLRARHRGALSGAPRRWRCCRGVVSRGDRAVQPDAAPARARAQPSRLRRVAAPRGPSRRGARAAADGRGDVRRDRDGGVRRARPGRAGRRRREAAQAPARGARGAHAAGGADRPARPRRAHQRGDRRASCSSARARSSGTCTRCSPSSGSTRAVASTPPCRRPEREGARV